MRRNRRARPPRRPRTYVELVAPGPRTGRERRSDRAKRCPTTAAHRSPGADPTTASAFACGSRRPTPKSSRPDPAGDERASKSSRPDPAPTADVRRTRRARTPDGPRTYVELVAPGPRADRGRTSNSSRPDPGRAANVGRTERSDVRRPPRTEAPGAVRTTASAFACGSRRPTPKSSRPDPPATNMRRNRRARPPRRPRTYAEIVPAGPRAGHGRASKSSRPDPGRAASVGRTERSDVPRSGRPKPTQSRRSE